jgi:hypothetical protein
VIRVGRRSVGLLVGLVAIALVGGVLALNLTRSATRTTALAPPHFVEETMTAGIDHVYNGDLKFFAAGGVAVFDCNGDRKPDLFIAGGSRAAALYRNESPVGGALRFAAVHDPGTDLTGVNGAYPLDIDGDGIIDLAVLRVGENVLLRGLGNCRFERANEAWGFDGGTATTTAFSAKWEGSTALPTMAFGNYVNPAHTDPRRLCDDNELIRPAPSGHGFGPAIPLSPSWCPLSMLFSDWDRSGRVDLRISNDRHYYRDGDGQEQLWRVASGQPPRMYTDADGWVPIELWGMGIASYDLTGDGYPEVFLTTQGENRLQTLTTGPSQPTYRDIGLKRGVTAAQPFSGGDKLPSTAWHPEFQDVNNDGFVDLFISKGNVSNQPDFAQKDPSNLLLGQPDGTFKEGADAAGIVEYARGRGAALVDFNLDGLLDLVKVNLGDRVKLWRNVGSGDATRAAPLGNWLALGLSQPGSNRDAIGAWIEVRVGDAMLRREVTVGGGHVGGQLGWIHFGLGSANEAQVRVQWPDGQVGSWMRVAGNQFADIERGATEPRPWQPPKN